VCFFFIPQPAIPEIVVEAMIHELFVELFYMLANIYLGMALVVDLIIRRIGLGSLGQKEPAGFFSSARHMAGSDQVQVGSRKIQFLSIDSIGSGWVGFFGVWVKNFIPSLAHSLFGSDFFQAGQVGFPRVGRPIIERAAHFCREISVFGSQFAHLSEIDTQFVCLSKFNTEHVNSFISDVSLPFLYFPSLFSSFPFPYSRTVCSCMLKC
jgi:hypothetical protein